MAAPPVAHVEPRCAIRRLPGDLRHQLELRHEHVPAGIRKRRCAHGRVLVVHGLVQPGQQPRRYVSAGGLPKCLEREVGSTVTAKLAESVPLRELPNLETFFFPANPFPRPAGLDRDADLEKEFGHENVCVCLFAQLLEGPRRRLRTLPRPSRRFKSTYSTARPRPRRFSQRTRTAECPCSRKATSSFGSPTPFWHTSPAWSRSRRSCRRSRANARRSTAGSTGRAPFFRRRYGRWGSEKIIKPIKKQAPDKALIAAGTADFAAAAKALDEALAGKDYVADKLSIADLAIGPFIGLATGACELEIATYRNLSVWRDRLNARESVRRTMADAQAGMSA